MYLELQNIHKTWKNKSGENYSLQNISLSILQNEFVCIIGPSGCGKTSLLKIMSGIVIPDIGKVIYNDTIVDKEVNGCSMIFQEPSLYPWKTVEENIELGLIFQKYPRQTRKEIVAEKIKLAGLENFEKLYPHQLSGGMKQKTQLARVLALNPDIVFLDEPFAAMDEILKNKFDNYLLNLWEKEQKTFVLVTHSLEEALFLADRIILMSPDPGKIHLEQNIDLPRPRDLFSKDIVELRKHLRNEISKFY
ncbi:MAG: ABC transporter ATP-binding protein [Marinifilum sp.]|jgi:ABC-type nitrate/sulfonate/bicarbonate transport system ATPase subunit|nr:ABC transporter ATP-binding protein [Marinifilum sp.]